MDHLDAFSKGFQGMMPVEDATGPVAKGVNHAFPIRTLQKHDRRCAAGRLYLLKYSESCLRAVPKLLTDKRDVGFLRAQAGDDFFRASG
jgi:hypothetical protein